MKRVFASLLNIFHKLYKFIVEILETEILLLFAAECIMVT